MNTKSKNDTSPQAPTDPTAPAAAGNGMPAGAASVAGTSATAGSSNTSKGSGAGSSATTSSSNTNTRNDPSLNSLEPKYPSAGAGDGMPAAAADYAGVDVPGSKNAGDSSTIGGANTGTTGIGSAKKEQLRQEIGQLRSELDVLVSHAATLSERELGEAYQMLMARFQTYRTKAMDLANNANQQLNQRMEVTRGQVKEKPVQSVAIAAGAGMLMGLMMGGKRRQRDQDR